MAGRQVYLPIFLMLSPRLELRTLAGYITEKIKFNDWFWVSCFICSHFYIDSALVADICQAETVGTIAIYLFLRLSNYLLVTFSDA